MSFTRVCSLTLFVWSPASAAGLSPGNTCLAWLGSPMLGKSREDSLVRELVVCHSVINAHVSKVRVMGHDLWFLDATCKGCDSTWVPSTLRVSQIVFPRHYQNRWFTSNVWKSTTFDPNRWIYGWMWSRTLLCFPNERLYMKGCTR